MEKLLKDEKERLTRLIRKTNRQLDSLPEGKLKIIHNHGSVQYYINGKYQRKSNIQMVKQIAQRKYDKEIVDVAEKKLKALNDYLEFEEPEAIFNVYEALRDEQKHLVKPIEETREQYEQKWMALEYESNNYRKEEKIYETQHGEKVRSKSEALIANILFTNKICYRYEYPVKTQNGITVYPDFYVLNSRTHEEFIYEHFGMMDSENYLTKNLQKINTYLSIGYVLGKNLLITFESSTCKFEPKQVYAFINQFFL